MAQIAVSAVKQMAAIEERARHGLQAYSSGEDSEECLTSLIALIGGIYVEIHDCDLPEDERIAAFAELMEQVQNDRMRNKKVYFDYPLP